MWNFKAYKDFTLKESALKSSGLSGLWLYLVYFCSISEWDASPSKGYPAVNFALKPARYLEKIN